MVEKEKMNAIVLPRDRVVKIRWNEGDNINKLLEMLASVPGMKVIDRRYRG